MNSKTVYLPGLNGIRAIAAIAVVLSHITLNFKDFGLDPYIFGAHFDGRPRTLDLAEYGVTMFFTLSGFLITYLLWIEKDKQPINIKKFYFRRILRIWPLYYTYLLLCILTYYLFSIEHNSTSLLFYIFLSANIPTLFGTALPLLIHFWSLGVEEQFYLFWPWINKFKRKNITTFTTFAIFYLIGLKIYLHLFTHYTFLEYIIHINRFHCMLIGALAAIYFKTNNTLFIKITTNKYIQIIAWGALFIAAINKFHIVTFLDNEFISVITVFIIMGQVTRRSIISLENNILNYLGKISYGIYVIHPLLIFLFSKFLRDITPFKGINYIIIYTLILATTIITSHFLCKYLEGPFLKFKRDKYTVVKSSGIAVKN